MKREQARMKVVKLGRLLGKGWVARLSLGISIMLRWSSTSEECQLPGCSADADPSDSLEMGYESATGHASHNQRFHVWDSLIDGVAALNGGTLPSGIGSTAFWPGSTPSHRYP